MIFLFVLLYLAFPIFMTPVLIYFLIKNKKHYKLYLFMLCSNIGLIGYYFIPPNNFDLYRHFEKLDIIKYLNPGDIWNYGGENPLFIENFLFYFISLTNDYGLLPYIAITLTYFFSFLTVYEYGISRNVNKYYIIFSLLFVIIWFPILVPMSGIRFAMSLSITIYSIFLIYYKKNRVAYILIFLATFMHIGISLLIAVLFLVRIVKPKTILVILFTIIVSLESFIILLNYFPIEYFSVLAGRIAYYRGFMLPGSLSSLSYYCQFIFSCIALIYILIRKKSILENHPLKMYNYVLTLLLIFIIFYSFPTIVIRYSYLILIFIPIFIYNDLVKISKQLRVLIYFGFTNIMLFGLILQYLNMRGLIYEVPLSEGMITNFYKILLPLLNGWS